MIDYRQYRGQVKDGDIILTRAKRTFVSRLVRTVQGHSHTHIALAKWRGKRLMTCEFREFKGFDERPISSLGDFDHVGMNYAWGQDADDKIDEYRHLNYSYLDAALAAFPVRFIGPGLICSEFVARILYPQIKLPADPTPGDISRWLWEQDYEITKVKNSQEEAGKAMNINRKVFYDEVRKTIFDGKISEEEVEGIEVLLDAWEDDFADQPIEYLAYCLGTAFHETAYSMQPIKERGSASYKTRLYDVTGKNPKRARRMGNTKKGDGVKYCGRGHVQLTWKVNYRRASKYLGIDFVKSPDKVMIPEHSARIMFQGCIEGWFTGKKLGDYLGENRRNYYRARRVVNGLDCAMKIAAYAKRMERALTAAMATKPTVDQVRKKGSKTIKNADRVTDLSVGGGITGLILLMNQVTDIGNKFKGATESLSGLIAWVLSLSPVLAITIAAAGIYIAYEIAQERLKKEPEEEGANA